MKNKKIYVLTISTAFPKKHKRSGEPTNFYSLILDGIKKHTIRGNYELWQKRAEKINKGEAILSVRCWSGRPYNSKQIELLEYSNIGVEKMQFDMHLGWFINDIDNDVTTKILAENDGLSKDDILEWFKDESFLEPKAIIHFTDFRYSKTEKS